jgi:indoleamine 2,3-dioxygenase
VLPRELAAPWCALARRLGRPPVLSYASYALDNWRRFDRARPDRVENLAILQNFLGGQDEDWFILIHVEIEALAARALRAAAGARLAAGRGDGAALTARLEEVASALEAMLATLRRMPSAAIHTSTSRACGPFIHGWKNHPALPEGVRYEGVPSSWARSGCGGETGAQSTIVPVLDALLGVAHAPDPLREYLDEMRGYMPPRHRAFLEHIEAAARCARPCASCARARPELAEAYDACLRWLEAFRTLHLEYAAQYIHAQAGGGANPSDVGTGGTPFMKYLAKHRDETGRRPARLRRPPRGRSAIAANSASVEAGDALDRERRDRRADRGEVADAALPRVPDARVRERDHQRREQLGAGEPASPSPARIGRMILRDALDHRAHRARARLAGRRRVSGSNSSASVRGAPRELERGAHAERHTLAQTLAARRGRRREQVAREERRLALDRARVELLLRGEARVERRLGRSGAQRDLVDAGRAVALAREQLGGGVEEGVSEIGLRALAAAAWRLPVFVASNQFFLTDE